MKYSRFEELPVWQDAIELAVRVFEMTARPSFRRYASVRDQLERASMSISNNIAEGFERGATTALIYFLYLAKGSSGETRSILRLCERLRHFDNFKFEISDLTGRAVNISKQLNGWLESLKNSDIKGARYLTQRERAKRQQDQEFAEFDQEMARYRQELLEKLQSREKPALQSEGDGNIREL